MKLTTMALAIAFALPSTLAFAEGPMNLGKTCRSSRRQRRRHRHGRPYRNQASEQLREYSCSYHT
jgi:hypothetical protein